MARERSDRLAKLSTKQDASERGPYLQRSRAPEGRRLQGHTVLRSESPLRLDAEIKSARCLGFGRHDN